MAAMEKEECVGAKDILADTTDEPKPSPLVAHAFSFSFSLMSLSLSFSSQMLLLDFSRAKPKKKLDNKRVGPFEILEKAGALVYKLKLPSHWKIHPCFNKKLLTKYTSPAFPNQEQPLPPPPDLIEDKEEYEVKEVLDSRMCCV
ncbi:uncharacterized protein ARMOST_04650 [Armillaria ostoyae]|uniref:Tf2-1-like SH3-like domain-containing protein n=1 Tax=Armillaria ostoyae TaxID=47428 RepID=A0A284QXY8_ARMOS|nr:uncharacterized protein ARMOST_04650 [Armillaria ostoyae]